MTTESVADLFVDRRYSRKIDDGDGGFVHVHDIGSGPPVIIQQAFGPSPGTSAWLTWKGVVEKLQDSYRCILLDFPNFGLSSRRAINEPAHEVCARNTFHVMDELGIDSAPVLGTSMGGTVAIVMALQQPERVDRMMIGACHASTGGDPYTLAPFPSEVLRRFAESRENPPSPALIRQLLRSIVYDEELVTPELVEALYEWRLRDVAVNGEGGGGPSYPHSRLADLSSISTPTLIVHGRFDRMVPLEHATLLMSYLSQANLVVLNRCGHWPPFEFPQEYAAHARRFLEAKQ
ncbi:alpha/beta hydrolase [Saccharomonospora sp. NPDC046836]|uniref:alpha/beta fold hydrolase n=1 Tax=Saccharomonospora sp. NPDC046836 TaxID=3156921 RepID=UPI0033C263E2